MEFSFHTNSKNALIRALVRLALCYFFANFSHALSRSKLVGVNYGELGNDLPTPYQSIQILESMKAGSVKLYGTNPEILKLLSGTNIRVSIMVSNGDISSIASNQSKADEWVRENLLAYYPATKIRYVLVGNEVLSINDQQMWLDLVPAMRKIKKSIDAQNIHNIKVGTPLAMDIVESTFPPSSGKFRPGVASHVMRLLLKFLSETNSFFFLDVYPYFPWSADPKNISLDYALLKDGSLTYEDPDSGLDYTNLLDQMLDSVISAMSKAGYDIVRIAIAETGWPNAGDVDQPGANVYNAATYNRNIVKKMTSDPPVGTPARPGIEIPTFIFSLYNENQKPGPGTERHWGLVSPNGTQLYEVDLTGKRDASDYPPMPVPVNNEPYRGKIWCVAESSQRQMELEQALAFACQQGNGTCDALAPGKSCYEPVSLVAHASYAFSSYWAQFRSSGASCYFNGLAVQTITDPSVGSCIFPSVSV